MRKLLRPLAVTLATLALVSIAPTASASSPVVSASAQDQEISIRGRYGRDDPRTSVWDHNQIGPGRRPEFSPRGRGRWGRSFGAPEVNPGLAAGGLALLIGGSLVLLGRRRPSRVQA